MRPYIFALVLLLAAAPAQATLIISQYVEGSGQNQAIELWNTDSTDIGLTGWTIDIFLDGSTTVSKSIDLVGLVLATEVFVIARDKADDEILALADQTDKQLKFNGNDAIVLSYNGTAVDSIGQVGFDPGTEWGSGDESTQNNMIRRIAFDTTPDSNPFDAYILPSAGWDGYPQDHLGGLGFSPLKEVESPEIGTFEMLLMGLVPLAIMGNRRRRASNRWMACLFGRYTRQRKCLFPP